ncbi:hypothetical protein SEA_HUBBS_71 [Microbacterium phage Hubbs]|nr:hypothetical protein SEA_HUBBS_71 [Microbacterium phage Hubbs]
MTAAQSKAPGIYKKILDIRKDLVIEKTGWDERNEYAYFKADDIAAAVRAGMDAHNVIHRTKLVEHNDNSRVDDNGRFHGRHTNQYQITFIDVEDQSEFTVDVVSTGADIGGDKHARKAAVQAFKIAAIDLFMIVEGLDKFDNDNEGEAEAQAVAAPVSKAAEAKASLRDLDKTVGGILKDATNDVTPAILKALGDEVAEDIGIEQDSKVWRKDARAMEKIANVLVQAVKAVSDGVSENIEAAIKLAHRGEVD